MDTEEIDLLTRSLRELFGASAASGADASADAASADAASADTASGPAADVSARLRELGWDDVAAEHPAVATTLLFGEKGRALSSAALLDDAVLAVLRPGLADGPDANGVGGADIVCYPFPGAGSRPSSTADTTAGTTGGPAGGTVTGVLLRRPRPDERLVIPVADDDGTVTLAVAPASEFTVTPLPSLDHELGWYSVTGPVPADRHDGHAWGAAVAAAHRSLAAELIGVSERAVELAIEHTSSRRQFNAPIAAFQAVRHRLADAYVAIAAARALLDAAFAASRDAAADPEAAAIAATAAKARAGRAHQTVSANAVQVCGALGSTLEHPLHRYVNRGAVLDGLLGSSAELTAELGSMIRATVASGGEIPLLVEV
ncbi:MAG TPA: acyl-CoA dehydrogenase family protein [Trebonia sp.]